MTITTKPTQRGFERGNFRDYNGVSCSIQESSAMGDEGAIWLGCNDIGLIKFTSGGGWEPVELEMDFNGGCYHSANTRMHLTQSMVRDLLPLLQHFAETGNLPGSTD